MLCNKNNMDNYYSIRVYKRHSFSGIYSQICVNNQNPKFKSCLGFFYKLVFLLFHWCSIVLRRFTFLSGIFVLLP